MVANAEHSLRAMIELCESNVQHRTAGGVDKATQDKLRKELATSLNVKNGDNVYISIVDTLALSVLVKSVIGDDDEAALLSSADQLHPDDTIIPPIVHVQVPPINQLSNTNLDQMIWYYTLEFLRYQLIHSKNDFAPEYYEVLVKLYTNINTDAMFYNPQLFMGYIQERRYQGHDPTLYNITQSMRVFLNTFADEITHLASVLKTTTAFARGQGDILSVKQNLEKVDPEDVTYYKSLILGSTAESSKHGEGFVCGNCGKQCSIDRPIVRIDSALLTRQITADQIRGYIEVDAHTCPNCGKVNLFPSEYMESIISVMTEMNGETRASTRQSPVASQKMALGENLLDRIDSNFRDKEFADSDFVRSRVSEELQFLPEIEKPAFSTLTTFPDVDFSSAEEMSDLIETTLQDMELLKPSGIVFTEREDETNRMFSKDSIGLPDTYLKYKGTSSKLSSNVLSGRQIQFLEEINKGYSVPFVDIETGNDEPQLEFKVSKYLYGFARLFLQNEAMYGYSESEALRSIFSQDKPYYNTLLMIRDFQVLKRILYKLNIIVDNLGVGMGCEVIFTTDHVKHLVAKLESFGFKNVFPDVNLGQLDFSDLNFRVTQVGDDGVFYEKLRSSVKEDLGKLEIPESLKAGLENALQAAHENASVYTGEGLTKPYNASTVVLKALYSECKGLIDGIVADLENTVLEEIQLYARGDVIRKQDYEVDLKSPLYFLSKEFTTRVLQKVYYILLKNTMEKVDLIGVFKLNVKDTKKPLENYEIFIRSAAAVFSPRDVSSDARVLFNTVVQNCIKIAGSNASGDTVYPYLDYRLVDSSKIDTKLLMFSNNLDSSFNWYPNFIANVMCDLVNICQSDIMFENITGLDSTIINRDDKIGQDYADLASRVAIMFNTPKISEDDNRSVNDLIASLNVEGISHLFPADEIEESEDFMSHMFSEYDPSEDDTAAQDARAQKLMLIFNSDLLDASVREAFIASTEDYDSRNY